MLEIDPIHFKVIDGDSVLVLQPLSFTLFIKLYERRNQIVATEALRNEVWDSQQVSTDTVKQRIFLLRKALSDSSHTGISIQSVRGKGYRLITKESELTTNRLKDKLADYRPILIASLIVVLAMIALYYLLSSEPKMPANNRIVFWQTTAIDSPPESLTKWQEAWTNLLSSDGSFTYIKSTMSEELTLPQQARYARAALVSLWDVYQLDGQLWLRMQILEPKTATILKSQLVAISPELQLQDTLQRERNIIVDLINSKILPLPKEVLVNTDHPAWDELTNIIKKYP